MPFSDSINYDSNITKPIKYANSDSPLFNSSESLSDDTSSSGDLFQKSSNTNPPFKQILKAPDTNEHSGRTLHPSQNQSTPPTTNSKNTRTHYNLRQQPKMDYHLFIPSSKF